ncbi:Translin-associated protein X [Sesbania bispinosa]|nr:Translin-associated protein X [Sesbania bispinosa]
MMWMDKSYLISLVLMAYVVGPFANDGLLSDSTAWTGSHVTWAEKALIQLGDDVVFNEEVGTDRVSYHHAPNGYLSYGQLVEDSGWENRLLLGEEIEQQETDRFVEGDIATVQEDMHKIQMHFLCDVPIVTMERVQELGDFCADIKVPKPVRVDGLPKKQRGRPKTKANEATMVSDPNLQLTHIRQMVS